MSWLRDTWKEQARADVKLRKKDREIERLQMIIRNLENELSIERLHRLRLTESTSSTDNDSKRTRRVRFRKTGNDNDS